MGIVDDRMFTWSRGSLLAIVGNGGAAAEAVLALRRHGYSGDLHLFSENDRAPYNPTLGSYLLAGAVTKEQVFPFGDAQAFYGGNRVTAHLGQPVTGLDAVRQALRLADGSTCRYDRCLLASGAQPSLPPVSGLSEAWLLPIGERLRIHPAHPG